MSCKTFKPLPGAVGIRVLNNYIINPATPLHDSLNYMFFTIAVDFNNSFSLTKSSPGSVTIPDFAGQAVMAIARKTSTDIVELKLTKAEIAGEDMNIYYEVIRQEGTTFSHTAYVCATVPKAIDVKRVHFFDASGEQKMLHISF